MEPMNLQATLEYLQEAAGRVTGVAIRYVDGVALVGFIETRISDLTTRPIDRVVWTECPYSVIVGAMPSWEHVVDQAMDVVEWPEDGTGIVTYTRLAGELLSVAITGDAGTGCRIIAMPHRDAKAHGWIEC